MTEVKQNPDLDDEDEDEDEEDYYQDDDYAGEWEDTPAYHSLKSKLPDGWDSVIKISNYTYQDLLNMDEWLQENCTGAYQKVNWSDGCSRSTGVMVEDQFDAIMLRLRWS